MNKIIADYLNIAAELILEVQSWAKVLWVRVQGLRPRFVSKMVLVGKIMKETLKLTSYGRKGIHAYVCPLAIADNGVIMRGAFHNGTPLAEEREKYYRGKSVTVEIDLEQLSDGLYEYKEANGHKTAWGYLKVEAGTIVKEWDTQQEMIQAMNPLPVLPQLVGSPKQIAWAIAIREKAIQGKLSIEKAMAITQAKTWIDNRETFNA